MILKCLRCVFWDWIARLDPAKTFNIFRFLYPRKKKADAEKFLVFNARFFSSLNFFSAIKYWVLSVDNPECSGIGFCIGRGCQHKNSDAGPVLHIIFYYTLLLSKRQETRNHLHLVRLCRFHCWTFSIGSNIWLCPGRRRSKQFPCPSDYPLQFVFFKFKEKINPSFGLDFDFFFCEPTRSWHFPFS